MPDKPQKPVAKLTTKEAMERLFPRPVIEQAKREAERPVQQKPSIPKE